MKDKMANKHSVDVHNIEPQARDITEGKQSQDASALLSAIVDWCGIWCGIWGRA